jgi:putative hemolysin
MNEIILGLIAVFLQGVFAGSETAFSRANWIRLTTWKKRRSSISILRLRADRTLNLLRHKEQILITTLILTNLFVVVASTIFSRFFIIRFGPAYTTVAVLVVIVLSLVFGDFLPKIIAQAFPEYWAIFFEPIIRLFTAILKPVLPRTKPEQYQQLSRRDFLYLLKEKKTKESLTINQMAKALFEFSKMTVGEIMIPEERIIAFPEDISFLRAKKIIEKYRFSRYPVYRKNISNIMRIIHIKDMLMATRAKPTITDISRKPYFVAPHDKAMDVLRAMGRQGEHMGIVQNDKHETIGMITYEDLLEELVGEIRSET